MNPARWYGIRHLRWLYWSIRFWRWWEQYACYFWFVPNQADIEYLQKIKDGKA